MNPKISDFGMARILRGSEQRATNRIVGTYGYMAPEYALEGVFSVKSDVFSFGVLLLEILSGIKNTGLYLSNSLNLIGYAWDLWTSNRPLELMNTDLQHKYCPNAATRYINTALLCVEERAADRPTMLDVVMMLNNELAILPSPVQPAFLNARSGLDSSCLERDIAFQWRQKRHCERIFEADIEIDEDEVQNNDVGPNIGEIEVLGTDGVENNEDGHVLGETEVVGLVGVENNDDGPVMRETEAARHVLGESKGVGPVLGERGDGDNEGSEKVGRSVNADSNNITTATAESDEDDDNDPDSYETDSEGELCVKKGKKLFFDDKGEVPRIELGMIFENSEQFKEALGAYVVAKRFDFRYTKNDLDRTRAKCKGIGCPYMIYAFFGGKDGVFRVRTYVSKHSYSVTFKNRRANYRFIGKHFLSKLKILPNLKLKDMMRLTKDELKVELNKNLCQRARVWANQKIRGRLEDEFNKLFDYVYTLREADPNGTFDLFVQRPTPSASPIFKRLYVCFGGLKEGFKKHCRSVLSLDGCYLKGDFKEVENKETWAWFLEHIQIDLEIGDGDRFTILSDMQKGLLEEMQLILPNVEHRYCARHIYANWKKENSGHDMQQLFWACCKATTEAEFHKHSARMATLKDTALSSLLKRDPKHWSKAFFRTHSKCDTVNNNFGEAFNSTIIYARYWDLTGIPCSHSICVILFNYKPLERGSFLEEQNKREKGETIKGFKLSKRGSKCTCRCCGVLGHNTRTCHSKNNVQTQDSTSLQPAATDVSQPPAPNPSQPTTTDVSQPPAPNPSQPATSQTSQPQFPNSKNTSTKTKGKASCGRQSTKPSLGPRGREIMEGIELYTNEKTGMQILNLDRPSQMLVRRPNTRSHATMSEPVIPSLPAPLSQQYESTHYAPVYQPAVMSTAPPTFTNHGNIIHKLLPRRRSS
ncbi:hypothetical protein V6N13_134174 [Hibiscus sabdariffa]